MLKTLQIKDYALIENIFVTFENGLNIITGETGAGKSIIIDALSLILGERSDFEAVRRGEKKAIVEGTFEIQNNKKILYLLDKYEIDNYDELIIRREVTSKGKTRAFINDTPVNISVLKAFGNLLVDLHGQHQHQSLLYPENHLLLIDEIAENKTLSDEFKSHFNNFSKSVIELNKIIANADELKEKSDYLAFQLKEIDAVSPDENEDEILKNELLILENSEKLSSTTAEIFARLYEDENAIYNQIVEIGNKLKELKKIDPIFEDKENDFNSALVIIDDVSKFLQNYRDKIDISPERLNDIRERLGAILLLKKKYGGTLKSVIKSRAKIASELSLVSNLDEEIQKRRQDIEKQRKILSESALRLSYARKNITASLSHSIEKQLDILGLSDAKFSMEFSHNIANDEDYFVIIEGQKLKISQNGIDKAEFFISTNLGEELKPLSKVASGGEISRVMLAIKSVIAKKDKLPLLIFDEIDTGVSGRIAQKVGIVMKDLAEKHQIIAITHLAQIAALADNHFVVKKYEHNGRILSDISKLENEDRVVEIAKLLSGENISRKALETAKILMNSD